MKSTRKHELQTNELADALGRAVTKAKPHANLLGYAALAVVALVVVLVVLPGLRGRGAAHNPAAEAFMAAEGSGETPLLRSFLKEYASAPQVQQARLLLANRLVDEVVRGDPKASPTALAEAKEYYGQVSTALPGLASLAQTGLALVAIQEGEMEKGRAALEEVVKQWPDSLGAAKAKVQLEALAAYRPVEFSSDPLDEPKPKTEAKKEPAPEAKAGEAPKVEVKPEPKAGEAPKVEVKPEPKAGEAPKVAPPAAESPKSESPKSEAPKSEAPKSEAPKSETPKP
jgi:hypothetical protein